MADIPIGSLRWQVQIVRRVQTPDGTTGVTETQDPVATVWADVQSVGALTFYGSAQVDTPITHRITLRWQGYLDQTYAVLRTTTSRDGSGGLISRTETFRVRRVLEMDGRKRFTRIEAELEFAA
jgi:head-tail adaptor